MPEIFYINNRFSVDPGLNLLKELETDKEHRLEPRLISLLCMLTNNVGKLTSRELLISAIWNDYGGAEDSLNQAISFLRKALKDSNKELIETVPKKGYILHASISNGTKVEIRPPKPNRFQFKNYATRVAAILAVLLTGSIIVYKTIDKKEPSLSHSKETLEVNFSEVNKPEEENFSNTITTTAPDGTRYRVVASGDKRPKLYVNDQLIYGGEIDKYSKLMDQMLRQLWARQAKKN